MKRTVSTILLVILLTSMLYSAFKITPASAYHSGEGEGHHFIFDQAKAILGNDGFISCRNFLEQESSTPGMTYLDWMKYGSDYSDTSLMNGEHYMDPMDHHGLYIWPSVLKSAGALCQEKFDEAVNHWNSNEFSDAMGDLGWAAHLIQDMCVPQHAMPSMWDGHSEYEEWVNNNLTFFAVNSGGIYSFSSFPDRLYYKTYNTGPPSNAEWHFDGDNCTAYDWADYNAHESIKYFLRVNSYTGQNVIDAASVYVETIHNLPNNLETTWNITAYGASRMQLHFSKIDMENGYDYVRICDKYDNSLGNFTGYDGDGFWTDFYDCDTLQIKTKTDGSIESWGYKIDQVNYTDSGEDFSGATGVLLPRAQRTTAGFIKFFFDKVGYDTSAPQISVLSPVNQEYGPGPVPLTYQIDEPTSWIGYSLDNQANVTIPSQLPSFLYRRVMSSTVLREQEQAIK